MSALDTINAALLCVNAGWLAFGLANRNGAIAGLGAFGVVWGALCLAGVIA